MRSDLRKLLARLRVGVIDRDQLVAAVERACGELVTERFEGDCGLRESSPYARPFLSRFEDEVFRASLWAPAGEVERAVRAIEGAARALAEAGRIARAHAEREACRRQWRELSETTGLDQLPGFPTGRTVQAVLGLAESALARGESRKAGSLALQCRAAIGRLGAIDSDSERRRTLGLRIVAEPRPEPEVVGLVERWMSEGRLALAERVWVDASIGARVASAPSRNPRGPAAGRLIRKLLEAEREASALAPTLARIGGSPARPEPDHDEERGDLR